MVNIPLNTEICDKPLKPLFAHTPIYPTTQSLIRRIGITTIRSFAHCPIHRKSVVPDRIRRSMTQPVACPDLASDPGASSLCCLVWIDGKWTMPPSPARPSDNRPSGETAIGIPIAYPAISHQIGLDVVPEAPCCCESSDKSNSDRGRKPVIRAGGTARRPGRLSRDAEARRRRELPGCPGPEGAGIDGKRTMRR
ncbi:hypothetical protein JOH51_007518 [Rhizobium leguminosarum]|nr:hypothetical protein [Rhizobium leguminosarum]